MDGTRKAAPARVARYHHGDLRNALLAAAEAILEREGLNGLTLRAVARAGGVSHAAPAHHFGDLTGLLSELAAAGFRRLGVWFQEALASAGPERPDRLEAIGRAYVRFARAHAGLFLLMFRSERLDMARPALAEAVGAAARALREAASLPGGNRTANPGPDQAVRAVAAWSLVHGFAMLLIDGRLHGVLSGIEAQDPAEALLDSVLRVTRIDAGAG